ncbi:Calcineurin-like phosphoesterase domain ApaH type [Trinorchestia longiramus]|nr:Calcineurin-like phosphoesterase domain ApaH type [Trinorchestia longiramus]
MSSDSTVISIHKLTNEPNLAWEEMKDSQTVRKLNVVPPTSPPAANMLRFVCMSDTHSVTSQIKFKIPDGDVLLHAGDFTRCGDIQEIRGFNTWLGKLPHKHKVVIAGNHELSFDPKFNSLIKNSKQSQDADDLPYALSVMEYKHSQPKVSMTPLENPASLLTNAIYLQDSLISIAGVKIYGTPWQPEYCHGAFNLPRGAACLEKWSGIPAGVDVLLTHTPPLGFGDLCISKLRAGCVELLSTVQNRVLPKYHVYGHIHESYGITTDGKIIFVNASTCDVHYRPCNSPLVFDVPIPSGYSNVFQGLGAPQGMCRIPELHPGGRSMPIVSVLISRDCALRYQQHCRRRLSSATGIVQSNSARHYAAADPHTAGKKRKPNRGRS